MNKYLIKLAAGFGTLTAGTDAAAGAARIASVGQSLKGVGAAKGAMSGGAAVSKGAAGMRMSAGSTGEQVLDAGKSGFFDR